MKFFSAVIVFLLASWASVNAEVLDEKPETQLRRTQAQLTLLELVAATPSLSTLGAAVVRAGLDVTLSSDQVSLTVFAPSNEAFAKIPVDLNNTLFTNDAFIPHLTNLLLYHVLGTKITTKQRGKGKILSGPNAKLATLCPGESLKVTRPPIKLNGNTLSRIDRDILASNGIVDIIDGVLLPSWVSRSITDRVFNNSNLSTLFALVNIADLGGVLAAPGIFTLAAPINSAFAKLPVDTLTFLRSAEGKANLTSILLYHVFPDIIVSSELSDGNTTSTLEGGTVTVSVNNTGIFFNSNAKVVKANILTNNGVVHKINTVLDPSTVVLSP